ncbi:MAG: DNA-binding response regulator [Bacteroidetes bacterium]|nr:MAG: DNA-binding response regulator [Bacteroidota bacterium]
MTTIPVYVIANGPVFLLGFEQFLIREQFNYCGGFLQQEAQLTIDDHTPCLLIVHLVGKFKANLGYLKGLLKRYRQARIMVLHAEDAQKSVKAYFQTGIKAYALPTVSAERLQQGLHFLARGQSFIDPELSQRWSRATMGLSAPAIKLTRREKEVLSLIVQEYTTKEIAQKLFISNCTAETHRLNIIHKLGVRNTAGVVREAVLMGW